ncbi:phosphoglycerate dehydrogenase [Nisaea sp.]|uniref:phosphoglycerate dehydrogenase n=1 Tax=Nisaea sp. TaxID=2024842 RepID=UPI002B26AB4B|nr:phosphoglycerate dehydrogenase [Nisaea sp.]
MSDIRVAVASRSFSRHPVLRQEVLEQFPNATFNDAGVSLKGDALIEFLAGHDRAITALEKLDHSVFAALPDLKVISKYGVGLDMIDLDAMTSHGVHLGWTGGVNRRSVAELALSFAIALLRLVPENIREVRDGVWRQERGRELSHRTVGIIGCGHVGKDLIRLLQPFKCEILVHDVRAFPSFYKTHGVTPVPLEELLSRSEIVSLHVPLDDTTRQLLNAERLGLMRPDAILLNLARGDLVDETALAGMLEDGRLFGAGFDVFANEPPTDMRLFSLPRFLGTPHIGGTTEEGVLAMGRAAIQGLTEFGQPHEIVKGQQG